MVSGLPLASFHPRCWRSIVLLLSQMDFIFIDWPNRTPNSWAHCKESRTTEEAGRHAVWLGSHNGPRNVSQWAPLMIRKLEKVQLAMFKSKYDFQSSREAATILQRLLPEVRGLFEQVEILVRLLITVPASSAEAERSFSVLRRLTT